jgi:hypothetical protein
MPRKACTETIEHRITLGEVERRELKKFLEEHQELTKSKKVANYGSTISWPVIGLAAAAGVGVAGWYIAQGLANMSLGDINLPTLQFGEEREDGTRVTLSEMILGKDQYTFTDEDGTTRTYNNPVAGIPIIGSLFGTGINLGEASKDWGMSQAESWFTNVVNNNPDYFTPAGQEDIKTDSGYTAYDYDLAYCETQYEIHKDYDQYMRCKAYAYQFHYG